MAELASSATNGREDRSRFAFMPEPVRSTETGIREVSCGIRASRFCPQRYCNDALWPSAEVTMNDTYNMY